MGGKRKKGPTGGENEISPIQIKGTESRKSRETVKVQGLLETSVGKESKGFFFFFGRMSEERKKKPTVELTERYPKIRWVRRF